MSHEMDAKAGVFNERSEDFHLKEYESLRHELETLLQDHRALERNAVVAVGITWGFLIKEHTPGWTYCIPCLFAILGALRAKGISNTYTTFGDYLHQIEAAFSKPGAPAGWEHFIKKGTDSSKGGLLFWVLLILSTGGVAVLRLCHVV